MDKFKVELTEDQIDALRNGDYIEVEAVIEDILEQVEDFV